MAYRDGAPFPKTIFEAAALHYSVKAHCSRCSNAGIFDAAGLWWWFRRKRWSDRLGDARQRFYCNRCACGGYPRTRPSFLEIVSDKPVIVLPQPDDREWKRAVQRFRC